MNYSMFQPPSPPGGGLQPVQNLPAGVVNYILSTDIENTLNKVTSSGGSIMMPKTEIPGMGHFAVFQDPTGITLAVYEAETPPRQARPAKRKAATRTARGNSFDTPVSSTARTCSCIQPRVRRRTG